jgi:hypothetical protein
MGRKSITLSQISDELTGDAQAMARLMNRPLIDYPDECWLDPGRRKVTADGRQQSLRYWLYETLTQAPVGDGYTLRPLVTCISPDCVNPKHQARAPRQRPGRKPGQAPQQRSRSAVDVTWPDAQTLLMLLLLDPPAWQEEYRTRCWEWTGPVQQFGQKRLPKLKGQAAHHAVWELFNRRPLQGRFKKACRNDMCVNPTHLIIPAHALAQTDTPVQPVHAPAPGTSPPEAITLDGETLGDLREDLLYMLGCIHQQPELLPRYAKWLLNRPNNRYLHDLMQELAIEEKWVRTMLEQIQWTYHS